MELTCRAADRLSDSPNYFAIFADTNSMCGTNIQLLPLKFKLGHDKLHRESMDTSFVLPRSCSQHGKTLGRQLPAKLQYQRPAKENNQ